MVDELEGEPTVAGASPVVDADVRLRELERKRRELAALIVHDLRNPLAAITMAAGTMLRRDRLDESDQRNVTRIINSTQRIGRMITQVLDLTRARLGGGLVLDVKPADLREICQGVVDEFETGSTQLDVEGELSGTWDRDRLAQVLSNVVGNALEYAAAGTAVVIRAWAEAETVVVEISNQGAPIPEEVLPFIFEPFRRAKRREISKTGNLGLGLYIAHQIVLAHGGTLDARSFGGRTTFAIRLPRRRPPA